MDDKDKFRELLELFVRTEKASPAFLGLLEQRLVEAIGPEIDAEIVRHSLLVHSSRPRSAAADHVNCPLFKSNKLFLSEFRSTDSESSSHQTSGQPPLNSSSNTQHSLMVRHKIQGISNQLAQYSTKLKAFRAEMLEECKQLVKSLWQIQQQKKDSQKVKKGGVSSGIFSPQRHLNGSNGFNTFSPHFLPPINFAGDERHKMDEAEYDDSDSEEEDEGQHNTMVELSSFSLDHSMQEWPDEEMQNIVWLICSDGMEQSVRLTNIQKLHFVSPVAFSKSKAFEIFLGHLHAILPLPLLFNETMHILARIMNCPNEKIWLKIVNCLSRVAHGVMRSSSLALNDKKCFADFFRQLLCYGPHIWRAFEQPNICRIVHDFVEMLTVEISAGGGGGPSPEGFLTILAQVDPEAQWLLSWLHRRSILTLMMPKFSEMINEILDHHGSDQLKGQCHSPRFWAFEASILFRCLQHSPVFAFLSEMVPDNDELRHSFCRAILHFLTLAFAPPIASGIRPKGFGMARRIMVKGVLETATSDCGAAVLSSIELFLAPLFAVPSSVGAPLFVQMPSPSSSSPPSFSPIFDLCLRVLLNVLLFAPPGLSLSGDVPSFLAKVEQSLRHHLTLFIHHNDNPFSNEITVQVLNALFEHFTLDQLRSAFSELIHSLLISNIAKLDHSNPNHRRLIVSIACLTFMDNNLSQYQWRKSVGKLLNKIALRNNSSIFSNGISPTNPHNEWATFPSTIELNETEKHLTTNALLHFLGLHQQRDERVPEKLARVHHQKPKSVQNGGAKKNSREIGRQSHHSAPFFSMPFGRFETEPSPKIVSSSDGNCSHKSIAEDAFLSIHCLDFLPSAPNDFRPATFHAEPLPDLVFFLVTQSELLVELLHLGKIGHYLLKEFTTFERLKDSGADQRMIEFIGKMDFMIINFDMLTELRHFVPNLGAKCVELLHKYCSDSSGNLLLSELSRTICLFLSHSFVASSSERRFGTFDRIGQMNAALANIPKSIYKKGKRRRKNGEEEKEEIADEENEEEREEEEGWEEEEEEEETEGQSEGKGVRHQRMEEQKEPKALQKCDSSITPTEDGQTIDDFCKSETADQQLKQQEEDHNHFGTITVYRNNSRTVSMQMEDKDFQFWFAVLPEKDTVATRHALLQNLFSSDTVDDGKMMNIRRMRSKPFELLNKFATKFWPMPEEKRMTIKPPQHSEWLSLLADYAHGLALMRGSRAAVRKRIGTLRLLQQQNGRAANDWFVAALFLSSGLSAEATSDLCDRLMEWRRIASVSSLSPCSVHTIWPMCCSISPSSAHRSFSELLALRVFPRVLSLLRLCPAFRPLRGFLSSCQLPSLFHLLLFYTNQAYLGILPFRAVQEYLVVAVLGGPEFQALHFCAVLAHIFHSSTPQNSLHFSSKLISLFLRPIFLADFRFSKYALFKTEENG